MRDYFKEQGDRLARARLRLLVAPSESLARELKTQITDEGRDFAELVRQHSLHGPSRVAGGSIGTVLRLAFPPETATAIFSARPSETVGPFAANDGFHLYLVEELLPAELNAETEKLLRHELFNNWLREQLQDLQINVACLEVNYVAQ